MVLGLDEAESPDDSQSWKRGHNNPYDVLCHTSQDSAVPIGSEGPELGCHALKAVPAEHHGGLAVTGKRHPGVFGQPGVNGEHERVHVRPGEGKLSSVLRS